MVFKDTILAVLNAEAQSLGADPVTERALEDWISEELLPGPAPKSLGRHGSEWMYSPAALRAALGVVKLKAAGPTQRNTVLRIRLWLLGFDVPTHRIAEDLRSEFSRLLHRHFFRDQFRYDASGEHISEREKERERRRAGPLDPTLLEAGLELPRDDLLELSWEAISDQVGSNQFLKMLDQLVSPFLSEKGQANLADFLKSVERYVDPSGLFGARDEIGKSGLKALAAANEGDLLKGRRLYQFALAMADTASRVSEFLPSDIPAAFGEAASKTARTLHESDEWCVVGLAVCSIAAHRADAAAFERK